MPLVQQTSINAECIWGLWQITESLQQLEAQLPLPMHDAHYLNTVTHEGKRMESLAVRILARHLLKHWGYTYGGIIKDNHDKPYLVSCPFHISISHTSEYAAVILHKHRQVGIDIEFVKEKLQKVAHKFLSTEEQQDAGSDLEKLCVYWSAKEVMYKKYGQKQVSLREDIRIRPFTLRNEGKLTGVVEKEEVYLKSEIVYMIINNLIISYSFE